MRRAFDKAVYSYWYQSEMLYKLDCYLCGSTISCMLSILSISAAHGVR
jgi:hypothetical protein